MLLNSPAITSHCLYNATIRKMRVSLRQSKNFGDHITFSHTCYKYKYTKVAFPIILEKVFDVVFNYITHHIRWHKSYVACEKNVHFTLSFTEDLTKPISRSLIPYFCNRLSIICNYSWKNEVSFDHFFFSGSLSIAIVQRSKLLTFVDSCSIFSTLHSAPRALDIFALSILYSIINKSIEQLFSTL